MAYELSGKIVITPPLNYAEIRKAQQAAMGLLHKGSYGHRHAVSESVFHEWMPVELEIEEFEEATDLGILKGQRAIALRPSHGENTKLSYGIKDVVLALLKALPGHNWLGTITAMQEELSDAHKVVVSANGSGGPLFEAVNVVKGKVLLRWEDGTEDDLSA